MIRDTSIYVFSRALPALLTLGSIALLTRYLAPAEFGRYSLALSMAGFLNVALMSWNLQAFYRFYAIYRGRRTALLNSATATGFVLSIALGTIFAGLLLPVLATELGWGYCLGAAALFPGLAALELASVRLNSAGLPGRYFALQLARAAGNLVAGGVVAFLTGSVVLVLFAVAAWWLAAASLAGMARWVTLLRFGREHVRTMRKMLRYGTPLTAAAGLYAAVSMLERLMLDGLAGPAAVGQFAAGAEVVQFSVGAIGSAIALSTYPRIMALYSRSDDRLKEELATYASYQIAIVLPLALGLALVAEPLVQILIGEQIWTGAAAVIPWAAAAVFVGVLKGLYLDFSFQLTRWTTGSVLVAAATIVTVFVLNLVLIPLYGAVGAAQGSLGGFTVAGLLSFVLGRQKALAMPFCVADLAKIAVAAAVMSGAVHSVTFASPLTTLTGKAVVGGLVYTGGLLILNPFQTRGIVQRILDQARGHRRHA